MAIDLLMYADDIVLMSSSEEGVEKTSQITGGIIFGYICTTKIACKDKYPLITIVLKLFDATILPVLSSGCELWRHVAGGNRNANTF